jgi:hypothetical protein
MLAVLLPVPLVLPLVLPLALPLLGVLGGLAVPAPPVLFLLLCPLSLGPQAPWPIDCSVGPVERVDAAL